MLRLHKNKNPNSVGIVQALDLAKKHKFLEYLGQTDLLVLMVEGKNKRIQNLQELVENLSVENALLKGRIRNSPPSSTVTPASSFGSEATPCSSKNKTVTLKTGSSKRNEKSIHSASTIRIDSCDIEAITISDDEEQPLPITSTPLVKTGKKRQNLQELFENVSLVKSLPAVARAATPRGKEGPKEINFNECRSKDFKLPESVEFLKIEMKLKVAPQQAECPASFIQLDEKNREVLNYLDEINPSAYGGQRVFICKFCRRPLSRNNPRTYLKSLADHLKSKCCLRAVARLNGEVCRERNVRGRRCRLASCDK